MSIVFPWELYRNGNSESSVICQYVCQSVLFVQPIRSFNLISMLVHCLHMKITTCLLVLINQLRKWDNSFSCELVSSLSAYESCLIYLEKSCHSILSSSMNLTQWLDFIFINKDKGAKDLLVVKIEHVQLYSLNMVLRILKYFQVF